MGAAGRDFHNFNVYFRDNPDYDVVAFTATQIPNIEGRVYPAELAGKLYPKGIRSTRIRPGQTDPGAEVHQVVFAYSDISHETVMHKASIVLAAGADFRLMGGNTTMVKSTKPVVAVCAVRTGSGKSQTTRRVVGILRDMGYKVVSIRHPMPYGDLVKQAVQRYANYGDLDTHACTIEEREEYEPHIDLGALIYAGVDYERILREAEKEADIIVWDGGNNDLPFYKPDLHIVVDDPHRPGHDMTYHPGEANLRRADVVVINKIDTARHGGRCHRPRATSARVNPKAIVIEAASPIFVDDPNAIVGKDVLVIEDGPTLTHGEMAYGAGVVAAHRFGAAEHHRPAPLRRRHDRRDVQEIPRHGRSAPGDGLWRATVADLAETITMRRCDLVIIATPIDLRRVIEIHRPTQRVRYELQEIGQPNLVDVLAREFGKKV